MQPSRKQIQPDGISQTTLFLVCFILFSLSVAQHWTHPTIDLPRYNEALSAAKSLALTGTLANPFDALPTGPTAHVAPGFPAYAALLITLFGTGPVAYFALDLSANLAVALLLALLPLFTRSLGIGLPTGIVAAIFYLAAKAPTFSTWEASYAALLCMLLTGLVVRFLRGPATPALSVGIGLLWGIVILTSPSVVSLYIAWCAYRIFQILKAPRFRPSSLILLLLPLALVAPWTLRNYLTFGRLVAVRDNLGLELQVSNNPCASFNIKGNHDTGCFGRYHPNPNPEEARRIVALGEVAYNDAKFREAKLWIEQNPDRFLYLAGLRLVHFWLPTEQMDLRRILKDDGGYRQFSLVVWLATLLSLPGLYFMFFKTNRMVAAVLAAWLLLFPLVYYCVQYEHRYRIPIIWVSFVLGAHALVVFAGRFAAQPRS